MRKAKVWDARQLPAYLTVAQYGELMGICPKTVRRMCQRGELPAHKEGPRLWRISTRTQRWSSGRRPWSSASGTPGRPQKTKSPPVLEHRRASE